MNDEFSPRLTYAIAPPNRTTTLERRRAIAAKHSARIASLPIDALLVYDVQDETERNANPRPFAFEPKVDPLAYAFDELEVEPPLVVYRAVADLGARDLCGWLDRLATRNAHAVLVGAPSRRASASLSLSEAYSVCRAHSPSLSIGGVVIPERHRASGSEDARVLAKTQRGASFFVSQTVWSVDLARRLLRDLRILADAEGIRVPTILLTLSPCGSAQTLEFLEWLGVEVPPAVKCELLSSRDMLARSVDLATEIYAELAAYAAAQQMDLGCNVESVSTRGVEVEASLELLRRIDGLTPRNRGTFRRVSPESNSSIHQEA